MDDETLIKLAYVNISPNRLKTVKSLKEGVKTPTQIGKEVGILTNKVSKALRELKNEGIAECINEEAHNRRFYQLTDLGKKVAENIK